MLSSYLYQKPTSQAKAVLYSQNIVFTQPIIPTEVDMEGHLQATSVMIEDLKGPLTISALNSPPKYTIIEAQFSEYFNSLGKRFMPRTKYGVQETPWPKVELNHMSRGEPTYWPTDRAKRPDLLELIIVTLNIRKMQKPPSLYNDKTYWYMFGNNRTSKIQRRHRFSSRTLYSNNLEGSMGLNIKCSTNRNQLLMAQKRNYVNNSKPQD